MHHLALGQQPLVAHTIMLTPTNPTHIMSANRLMSSYPKLIMPLLISGLLDTCTTKEDVQDVLGALSRLATWVVKLIDAHCQAHKPDGVHELGYAARVLFNATDNMVSNLADEISQSGLLVRQMQLAQFSSTLQRSRQAIAPILMYQLATSVEGEFYSDPILKEIAAVDSSTPARSWKFTEHCDSRWTAPLHLVKDAT